MNLRGQRRSLWDDALFSFWDSIGSADRRVQHDSRERPLSSTSQVSKSLDDGHDEDEAIEELE